MKIVVISGSGLIGSKLVARLRELGHEVLAASPRSGVDAVTGAGLAEALAGAEVVVDVANAPAWEPAAVRDFFERAGRNLQAAEAAAGVRHHVALSIVGTDRLPENGYFQAKLLQERLIQAGPIPYTIVRATQFFEFVAGIAEAGADGQTVRLSPAQFQPMAADDVAAALADVATAAPVNGTVEIAGPERVGLDRLVARLFQAKGDKRVVVTDKDARYFGAVLDDRSLTPAGAVRLGPTRFDAWLAAQAA